MEYLVKCNNCKNEYNCYEHPYNICSDCMYDEQIQNEIIRENQSYINDY